MALSVGQKITRLTDRIKRGWYQSQMGSDTPDYAGKKCAQLYNKSWLAVTTAGMAQRRKQASKAKQLIKKAEKLLGAAERCAEKAGFSVRGFGKFMWQEKRGTRSSDLQESVELLGALVDEFE